jgi:hypothetical protein
VHLAYLPFVASRLSSMQDHSRVEIFAQSSRLHLRFFMVFVDFQLRRTRHGFPWLVLFHLFISRRLTIWTSISCVLHPVSVLFFWLT